MFPPREFFFLFFMWEFYNPQLSRQENLGFSLDGDAFVFAVKLYSGTFARAFYKDRS